MPRPPAPEFKPASTGPSMGLIGGVAALIIALVVGLVWWAVRGDGLDAEGTTSALPAGGGLQVGDGQGDEIQVYEDFQCPWCGKLEGAIGSQLAEKAASGEATVTYTIMSFLDGNLRNDSSARAANAALCADDAGAFTTFHEQVFANQPATEGDGWTDEQLVSYAEKAGITGDALETFKGCMADQTHGDYVKDMQERANKDGISGTPNVKINGEEITDEEMMGLLQDPSTLDAVIEAHQ